jgi:2-polyprenyl-6-methoxyphenol hydroxylase-like FAD-dependent oxidoreductase
MANIIVIGAGLNGLATAMLLAHDGHEVTVLERDASSPPGRPEDAWELWDRRGVNQFRMLHYMQPLWRSLLDSELPGVTDTLTSWGALPFNPATALPESMTGGQQPGDDRFDTVTGRRPVLEAGLAAAAASHPGVTIRRGVAVGGLLTGTPATRGGVHVSGVETERGERLAADLVVDTSGRRSPLPDWLEEAGARRPLEWRDDAGFIYFGRHYRARNGNPELMGGLSQHYDSLTLVTLPMDHDTWGVGFAISARDRQLRGLRDPARWEAALACYPLAAHWADGDPITGVDVMARIEDRNRHFVIDGHPVATGVLAVGDSWACTNPSLGRGSSIGLLHACGLRDLLREVEVGEPEKLAIRFDELTQASVERLYRSTLSFDRHRLAEIEADISGVREREDEEWAITKALAAAAPQDPEILRGLLDIMSVLATPDAVLARPRVFDRVIALGADAPRYPLPGPNRAQLLAALNQ